MRVRLTRNHLIVLALHLLLAPLVMAARDRVRSISARPPVARARAPLDPDLQALPAAARAALLKHDFKRASDRMEDESDREAAARYLRARAREAKTRGDLAGARAFFQGSLVVCQTKCAPRSIALSMMGLGKLAADQRDWSLAERWYQGALAGYRSVRDPPRSLGALLRLAEVADRAGRPTVARQRYQECLRLAEAVGDRERSAVARKWLADD
jgi:tetratricopeptide (TPR) repeat protein